MPILIHCDHGKHRGPAVAALVGLAVENWDRERARAWMKQAGTSPQYQGLFRSVQDFIVPTAATVQDVADDLPEVAKLSALVDAMVQIDRLWGHLTAIMAAGFRTPYDHPDLDVRHEARLLIEQYRELLRADEDWQRGDDFR